ncbi:MAG TPA: GAF domain-containing protein [Nannocystis exedens]|nr:GAF domain-containing protein [Nannocystis exedens]
MDESEFNKRLTDAEAKYNELLAYTRRLELIADFIQNLGASNSFQEVLQNVSHYLKLIFPKVARTSVVLVGAEDPSLTVFALYGITSGLPVGKELPIEGTLVGTCVTRRTSLFEVGSETQPSRFSDARKLQQAGLHAVLVAPMLSNGRVVGTLNMGAPSAEHYGPQDEQLLNTIATSLATYLQLLESIKGLAGSLDQIQQANTDLEQQLQLRIRAENELRDRENVISAQYDQMLAMSAPLLPIDEHVVVVPLVGSLSKDRVTRITEVALAGVQARKADTVIIDLTGLNAADPLFADALAKISKALRLLGCKTLVTGIGPKLAQILVDHDVKLDVVNVYSTLQAAVSAALRA